MPSRYSTKKLLGTCRISVRVASLNDSNIMGLNHVLNCCSETLLFISKRQLSQSAFGLVLMLGCDYMYMSSDVFLSECKFRKKY